MYSNLNAMYRFILTCLFLIFPSKYRENMSTMFFYCYWQIIKSQHPAIHVFFPYKKSFMTNVSIYGENCLVNCLRPKYCIRERSFHHFLHFRQTNDTNFGPHRRHSMKTHFKSPQEKAVHRLMKYLFIRTFSRRNQRF